MQDLLFFSHANGFPAPTYRALLAAWAQHFRVVSPDRIGHDPRYPVSRDWPHLADELIERLHAAADSAPRIWLVGHSLGGYLSILAVDRLRTSALGQRIAGLVLLDSPLISGVSSAVLAFGRYTGMDRWLMPLEQTRQRRNVWNDVAAVHAHYSAKPGFSRWDHTVLQDYVEHATTPTRTGRELLFDREIEYRIYRTLPRRRVVTAAMRLQQPVGFIAGTHSRELRSIGLRATRQLVGTRLAWIQGSHLFPMEHPEQTAAAVLSMIAQMATDQPAPHSIASGMPVSSAMGRDTAGPPG